MPSTTLNHSLADQCAQIGRTGFLGSRHCRRPLTGAAGAVRRTNARQTRLGRACCQDREPPGSRGIRRRHHSEAIVHGPGFGAMDHRPALLASRALRRPERCWNVTAIAIGMPVRTAASDEEPTRRLSHLWDLAHATGDCSTAGRSSRHASYATQKQMLTVLPLGAITEPAQAEFRSMASPSPGTSFRAEKTRHHWLPGRHDGRAVAIEQNRKQVQSSAADASVHQRPVDRYSRRGRRQLTSPGSRPTRSLQKVGIALTALDLWRPSTIGRERSDEIVGTASGRWWSIRRRAAGPNACRGIRDLWRGWSSRAPVETGSRSERRNRVSDRYRK